MSMAGYPRTFSRSSTARHSGDPGATPTENSTCAVSPASYLRAWQGKRTGGAGSSGRRARQRRRRRSQLCALGPAGAAGTAHASQHPPVLELGDLDVGAVERGRHKVAERARHLGDGDRQHRLALAAHVGQVCGWVGVGERVGVGGEVWAARRAMRACMHAAHRRTGQHGRQSWQAARERGPRRPTHPPPGAACQSSCWRRWSPPPPSAR